MLSAAWLLVFGGNIALAEQVAKTNYQADPSTGKFDVSALPFHACFEDAAQRYQVDADLLRAIGWHESKFRSDAHNTKNATPSEDIGVMQINSWWLHNGLGNYGIGRTELWDPCININVGAWILATEISRHGEIWTAVGYYNARTAWKRERYAQGVKQAYQGIKNGKVLAAYTSREEPTAPLPRRAAVSDVVTAAADQAKSLKRVVSVASIERRKPQIVVIGN